MEILFRMTQAMAVFVVVAYIYCKSPLFRALASDTITVRNRLYLYVVFSCLAILGTYLGIPVYDAIANTRPIGPILAGIIGGPILGTAVGLTGGAHRYLLGGFTAFSCGLATTLAGLLGGLVHSRLAGSRRAELLFDPRVAFVTALAAEVLEMAVILAISRPFAHAVTLVKVIALPMILANAAGAALFMSIIRDQRNMHDRIAAVSSAKAFKIAERTLNVLARGINRETAEELARIIYTETGVGSVAITDKETVIAFLGQGADHHKTGGPIVSPFTKAAVRENRVIFVDGTTERYRCPLSETCPMTSVLVVPLHIDNDVIGTINLYEPKHKSFLNMNKTLGEGIARLLSNQLLLSRYEMQKRLLVQAELKLLQAQVNPHFLFNALNTIIAILRIDAVRCKDLLIHLSNFFRKNLKRSSDLATLAEELDQVNSYLQIEKARFDDRLVVETEIDPLLMTLTLPTFTLQPLVENAFKHGIANLIGPGRASIRAYRSNGTALIEIEDNAGSFRAKETEEGRGIKIVESRLKELFGSESGVSVLCIPNELTRVTVRVPLEERQDHAGPHR